MQMRVAHVVHSLDPAAGGPPVVVRQLARAQTACGLEVQVAAVVTPSDDSAGVVRLPRPGVGDWAVGRGPAATAVGGLVADVFHLHGVWDPVLAAAGAAARRSGRPYVITPHGMLDPWCLGQKRWKKRLALVAGFRRLLDRAATVHWLNADEQRLAAPLQLRAPGVVVPNGVDSADLTSPSPAPSGVAAAGRGGRHVLFLSRLHFKKGLDVLADAFARVADEFPDVRLVVAGPAGGAEAPFRARVAALGLSGRVDVIGPVYGPDKWAALRAATCFCLPSRQEGFSMAILEALAAGTPAVVSEGCHFPEVATEGAGVVTPLTPEGVAGGLRAVLADPVARGRMGEAGRRLVAERFTWPRVAARWAEIYPTLVGGGRV